MCFASLHLGGYAVRATMEIFLETGRNERSPPVANMYACVLLQFMERGGFDEALESLDSLIADYAELDKASEPNDSCPRDTRVAF